MICIRPLASLVLANCAIALLTAVATTDSLIAQPEAFYPLINGLNDSTNNYGPVTLFGQGGHQPPAPPNGSGNGVCDNGSYSHGANGGQEILTPNIMNLDTNDFQVSVEFNCAQLPTPAGPILMAGTSFHWMGIYLDGAGTVGVIYNSGTLLYSTSTIGIGTWNRASVRYENGAAELYVNGLLAHQTTLVALYTGINLNFTTDDYAWGRSFNGCIRNLLISNDPGAIATATSYGVGCTGVAGIVSLTAASVPAIGATLRLDAANLAPSAHFALMTVGFSDTTSALGALPLNLGGFGLGLSCNLFCSADVSTLFGVNGGGGTFDFAVPFDAGFVDQHLFFQCGSIDSVATGGFALSNAVDARIGH